MRFREFHKRSGVSSIRQLRALFGHPPAPFKSYPRFAQISLPAPKLPETSFAMVLHARRSWREFSADTPLPIAALAQVLFCGAGIQQADAARNDGTPSRHHPSGGALYPLELYAAVFNVDRVPRGIYHYQPLTHALERLPSEPELAWDGVKERAPVEKPAVLILLSALWERSYPKYGEFAYRLGLMEAGHLMQNMLLCAEGLGVRSCPISSFDEEQIERTLDIGKESEDVLYVMLLGV